MVRSKREELWESMRYRLFIRVDAETMQSILGFANDLTSSSGVWVDLVQVDWPESELDEDENESVNHVFTERFSPIEGMATYEVGFQRVPVNELYPTCCMDKELIPEKWCTRLPKTS